MLDEGKDNLSPGGWSDQFDSDQKEFHEKLIKQEEQDRVDRLRLIREAQTAGMISSQYARLLESIGTSSSGAVEGANLRKTNAALRLKGRLLPTGSKAPVAYIGSGIDWQFAIALGARNIDMVDIGFAQSENMTKELLATVKQFDPNVTITSQEKPELHFELDLGKGLEDITLRLYGVEVSQYLPDYDLGGVIEFLGPSKGELDQSMPVLPNVARRLSPASFVANFDFDSRFITENSGLTLQTIGDQSYFVVDNKNATVKKSQESLQKKSDFWDSLPSTSGIKKS
ncbi:hypothetical protein HY612_03335 [Candidatus Roizmanbacteria bacterium]|nr:hypothetical protein [Candidatus Roizmanbacteria bacterium]